MTSEALRGLLPSPTLGTELRAWVRASWWWPAALAATLAACGALILAVPPGTARQGVAALGHMALSVVAAVTLWRTARHPALDPRTRQAWTLATAGQLLFLAGDVVWALYGRMPAHGAAGASTFDLCSVGGYVCCLFGCARFPTAPRSRLDSLKLWLDVGIITAAVMSLAWFTVFGPALRAPGNVPPAAAVSLAYPVADLLLLFGLAPALLGRPLPLSRAAVQFISMAGFALFASDVAYAYAVTHPGVNDGAVWFDIGRQVALAVWILAAQQQWWRAGHPPAEPTGADSGQPGFVVLPYMAALLGYGLLAVAARTHWDTLLGQLIGVSLLLTLFILARQLTAVHENDTLLAERVGHEARFRSLVQHSSDVVAVIDGAGVVRYMSPAVERVFGWPAAATVGKPVTAFVHPDDAAAAAEFTAQVRLAQGGGLDGVMTGVWRCRNRAGEWRHVEAVATSLLHDPTVRGIVLNARDVTERMALQAELRHQAYHDPLTQLANRTWFQAQVEQALARSDRTAVFFLDLDNFKTVNDGLGHSAGDALLVEVAARLLNATRGSDTVARLGGDEFAVLAERVGSDQDLTVIAERIAAAMRAPFRLGHDEVYSSTSIGIARAAAGHGVDDLLRDADVAMYVSKRRGKGLYTVYEPRMHASASQRLALEHELRQALFRGELLLRFQPVVDLETRRAIGVEALVRWQHPHRGLLPPAEFIPLAEESGLILPLGKWVLTEACHQAARWRDMLPPGAPFTISVNVSGRQLQHAGFVDEVALALGETGLPPGNLLLEITESVIVRDVEATLARLDALKALGVRLAIDDFGTGYSSLGVLQQFPIDVLKIDKSFVDESTAVGNGPALARTIVALGEMLSLQTVAEGVEHRAQAEALGAMGCTVAQGFHFSHPVPAQDIDALVLQQAVLPGRDLPAGRSDGPGDTPSPDRPRLLPRWTRVA